MSAERYTAGQAASRLGVTEEALRKFLREQRAELPPRDPRYPNLFTAEFVDALGELLKPAQRETTGDGATILAITSGKGGVGKTSLSVNLATQFAHRGYRTVLVDTDLGLANTHILAGVKPELSLWDYVEGKASFNDIMVDSPSGVKLVSGGSGVQEMANLDDSGRDRILEAVNELRGHCDVVLLDTAAGVARGVTDFVSISDHTVVVTTGNFAAIADAYGIIKVMVQAGYERPMHLLVNRVTSPEEGEQVYKKLKGCAERFLSFDLNWLGLLPEDSSVEGAVLKRTPFSESFPGSVATRYLKRVVTSLEPLLPAAAQKTS